MNIEIKNAKILTMVEEKVIDGNIYIKDNKIVKIGELNNFKADKKINAETMLAMPGLINAHTHLGMSLFRNFSDDVNLETWLNEKIWPLEDKLIAKDVYNASILSMAEMIMTGTTTFADMYYFEEETIKALEKTKMRGQISRGLTLPDDNYKKLNENIALFKNYNNSLDNHLQIALGPHAVYTTDKNYLKDIAKIARDMDIPIHIHLSETKKENEECKKRFGQSPCQVFDECKIFDNKTIAAHGIYLSDSDLDIIKEKEVSIIHNPSSNLKLASGFLDVNRLFKRKINVGLGTDSAASNNSLSMFKEMAIASLVGKYNDPKNMKAFNLLKMATINGAKALSLDKYIGTLEEGKLADIILIDINNLNHTPNNNLVSSLVYSTYSNDVNTVIINGNVVYENHEFTYLDKNEIMLKAKTSFANLRKRQ